MTLSEYIKKIGASEFAQRFQVTERAALAYQYGTRRPRPKVAERIIAGSPVTWKDIYASSASPGQAA